MYILQRQRRPYTVVICKNKSYITFVIDPPLIMAQSRAECIWDIYNYGQYMNQFPPNTIKAIRLYERIQKKICRQKISTMFNEICINEEMLPIYIYIYIIVPNVMELTTEYQFVFFFFVYEYDYFSSLILAFSIFLFGSVGKNLTIIFSNLMECV